LTPRALNALRTVELHPSVAKLLKNFIGPRTSGYIFPSSTGTPVHQSNFLRREFHPVLKAAGIPRAGFHGFRRYRNTFLRNVARCPSGLLKFWMGHADKDMSDLYDKVREDPTFRRAEARRMGVGFEVPKSLKTAKAKSDRFVVRRVVCDSDEIPPK
jgi:integrase